MTFKDFLTMFVAVAGLALGIWNRGEQWADRRRRLEKDLPWAKLHFDGQEVPESSSLSVRRLTIEFENPTDHRWVVDRVRLIQPLGGALRSMRPDDQTWGKEVLLSWTISASHEVERGRSNGHLAFRFPRQQPNASGAPGQLRVVEVRAIARELGGAKRRKIIRTHYVQKF